VNSHPNLGVRAQIGFLEVRKANSTYLLRPSSESRDIFVALDGESAADGEFSSWSGEVMDLMTDLQMEHKQWLIRAFYAFQNIFNPLL
jgi:hypothetical protein